MSKRFAVLLIQDIQLIWQILQRDLPALENALARLSPSP